MKWNYPYNIIIFAILCLWTHLTFAQLNSLDGGGAADIATWSQEMTAVPAKIGDGSWEIGSDLIDPNTSHLKPKPRADSSPARWWRVRSHFDPAVALPEKVLAEVEALAAIKAHGINSIIFTRWSSNSWKSGVRAGRVQGFPLDLREAFERGRGYGRAYGDVAAAFEIENEPDIDYVNENPETYMAFQKAMYLGIHRGAAEAAQAAATAKMEDGRSEIGADSEGGGKVEKWESGKSGIDGKMGRMENGKVGIASSHLRTFTPFTFISPASPLVVMAPLALPPGPFFERLIENGLLSYTDAFNYHYYGYAEDFTGVYEQFRVAVTAAGTAKIGADGEKVGKWKSGKVGPDLRGGLDLTAAEAAKMGDGRSEIGPDFSDPNISHLKPKTPPTPVRRLPVLLTEYGYGSLVGNERYTVEGRVRQWRWFSTVAPQIRKLRIAGPMAFYVPPYFEAGKLEFGLTMKAVPSTAKMENGRSEIGAVGEKVGKFKSEKVGPDLSGGPGSIAADDAKIGDGRSGIGAEKNALSADTGNVQKLESEKAGASEKVGRWEGGKVGPVATAPLHFATFAPLASTSFFAGDLAFTPADFGDSRTRPWMERIGNKMGNNEQSPALSWLLDYGEKHPYRPRDWTIQAPAPSSVVIDFIAGKNLNQLKRYGGYLAMNDAHGVPQVEGELVVYNFSNRPVSGRLEKVEKWEGGKVGPDLSSGPRLKVGRTVPRAPADAGKIGDGRSVIGVDLIDPNTAHLKPKTSPPGVAITLTPNERRVIPVSFSLSNNAFKAHTVRWTFVPDEIEAPTSVFSTQFYPESAGMAEKVLVTFAHASVAATGNRILLEKRKSAREETPFYRTEGRWRVTSGVQVNESTQGVWRFKVERAPSLSYGTSSAELPLPDDFIFPDHGVFSFSYRLVSHRNGSPASLPFDTYFRTANGNLYQVWPRSYAQSAWNTYMELKENFTMAFYNRSALPWRFEDNRPIALVFRFRPGAHIPATFEIANPRIGLLERK